MNNPSILSCFRGCLLGGAVGDALGAPVEFMTMQQLHKKMGWKAVLDYLPAYDGIGKITDDTQMSLFTAEGLLCAYGAKIPNYGRENALALLRWLYTQNEQNPHQISAFNPSVGLVEHTELHSRRAPGNTCLSALRAMTELGMPARNDSKGCGTVMRMAPVGLFTWATNQQGICWDLAATCSAATHGHPTGILSGAALATIVQELLNGHSLQEAVKTVLANLSMYPGYEETANAIALAISLADMEAPFHKAIKMLGQGWVAEEALAIAIYFAASASNFEDGVCAAASHDGDTDSTASIAGNILGIIHGVEGIPEKYLERLELYDVITDMADRLFEAGSKN
ncbi:ADP-ribosylglycohydrolase family protein [Salmonella enterica]|nr:ADP-ribosylglycohydrolase family protein [Salmonella enterica]EHA9546190.1 ADP-ribosylglycohydrolase family protein [Salmonella enterica subsp. enterica serovar Braenderup]EBH4941571.1 ADP-ribosylglycohydrolase family protein [Salmonella enterica]ECK3278495.1 ADP-ribosylglycohydrolase family protein [Salmonella enterica]ECK6358163.1 ADP-ribosylglycohydrolase family protein [Salmonella enterica]